MHMDTQATVESTQGFNAALHNLLDKGYVVEYRDEWYAQVMKPKKFSVGLFLLWTILSFGTLFWAYPLYYFARRPERRTLQLVDDRIVVRSKDFKWEWDGSEFRNVQEPRGTVKRGDAGIAIRR